MPAARMRRVGFMILRRQRTRDARPGSLSHGRGHGNADGGGWGVASRRRRNSRPEHRSVLLELGSVLLELGEVVVAVGEQLAGGGALARVEGVERLTHQGGV